MDRTLKRGAVAFLDSGIGGIPYLKGAREYLRDYPFLYLADLAHFPYGEKSEREVREAVSRAVMLLEPWNPGALVIACNTASVTALEPVRNRVDYPVIGVVPAVKPAAELSAAGRIGVLATSRTLSDPYLDGLIRDHAGSCRIVRRAAGELVRFVEERFHRAPAEEVDRVLAPHVAEMARAGVDTVVLGCTHFLYLRDALQRLLGDEVRVVDSVDGVARQLQKRIGETGLVPGETGLVPGETGRFPRAEGLFLHTGKTIPRAYRELAAWGGLQYGGGIDGW